MLDKVTPGAKKLDVSAESLRRMIREGQIPYYRVGRTYRVDVAELRKLFRREPEQVDKLGVAGS